MASVLEQLGIATRGLEQELTPFADWVESKVKEWKVTLRMLTTGELADLSEKTASIVSPMQLSYMTKVYLLAMTLVSINGHPVVTEEQIEQYNKEHNLTGSNRISMFDYKVLYIRKLSEAVVNKLAQSYDKMQEDYIQTLFGKIPQIDSDLSQESDESLNSEELSETRDS